MSAPKNALKSVETHKKYRSPRLEVFGQVRDLTAGGSKSLREDAVDPGMANPDPAYMA